MSQKPNAADQGPFLVELGGAQSGDQAACLGCAAGLVAQLNARHPKGALNTLLVAVDMFIHQAVPPEHQAATYRVVAKNFEIAAVTTEGEQAGVKIGPAQGRA